MNLEERLQEAYEADTREDWSINDLDSASYAGRKLSQVEAEIQKIEDWQRREIERVKRAADTERARLESQKEFFLGHLHAYLHKLITNGRKTKTLNLPTGTVSIRTQQPKLDLLEDEAIKWASTTSPDLLRVKQSIDLTALKKRLEYLPGGTVVSKDGEILDFIKWEPQQDKVYFKPESQPESND
jgi:phage host-nuclease inhibitor protein Gam